MPLRWVWFQVIEIPAALRPHLSAPPPPTTPTPPSRRGRLVWEAADNVVPQCMSVSTNIRRSPNVVLLLVQRRRRCTSNKPTLVQCLVLLGWLTCDILLTGRAIGRINRQLHSFQSWVFFPDDFEYRTGYVPTIFILKWTLTMKQPKFNFKSILSPAHRWSNRAYAQNTLVMLY